MATIKHRINITADADVEMALKSAAKRDGVPVASKAAELLRLALEIEEDLALAEIAASRDTKDAVYLPIEDLWKKALKKK